jgi:hypothetical protein
VSTADQQIRQRVEAFVKELETLIRQAAVEAVADALGVHTAAVHEQLQGSRKTPSAQRPATKPGRAAAKAALGAARKEVAPASTPAKKAGSSERRARRSPAELEAMGNAILGYVSKNPGQRAEQIKQALGLDAADWALPVKKLVDEGQLVTSGEKRATTYAAKRRPDEG